MTTSALSEWPFPSQGPWTEDEYWIVDPQTETIHVLTLDGTDYRLHGEFTNGMMAASVLLPTFTVDVKSVFDAGRGAI